MSIGFPIAGPDGIGTTPADARLIWSSHWASTGVISGGAVSTSSTGLTYSVASGVAVGSRGTSYGAVEFLIPSGTVTTTAGPSSGSRIDVVYALPQDPSQGDASADVVLGVVNGAAASSPTKPAIPTGAVELRAFSVPQGATKTSQASTFGMVKYAIPFGGTMGVLHKWVDQANGLANQNLLTLGSGVINLPTNRLVEFQIMPTISTNTGNYDGVCLYRVLLDDTAIASFEIMYREHWETRFLSLPFTVSAGTHTVAYQRYKRSGSDFYHHYGTQNGETYLGTIFQVIDRGVA